MAGRSLIGFLLLVFGVGFLLQQAKVVDFSYLLSNWWPLIIVFVGILQLVYRSYSSMISGILFITIGGLLLIGQFVDYNVWAYIWPLILIIAGASFLLSHGRNENTPREEDHIRIFSLFSGTNIKNHSSAFKGGTVTTVFGGAEIDLRNAIILEDAVIDVTAVFGGATIYVSENTKIKISGIPIFGGWEDKTSFRASDLDNGSVLKLHCHPLFGGIEVKN